MIRERAILAGMTDYTGVSMDTIISHIGHWRETTSGCIEELNRLRTKVELHRGRLDWPDETLGYLDYFVDLLGRYLGDFDRLADELPHGVESAHVEIVRQIYCSSRHEERHCVRFKKEHIECGLKDEQLRGLVDRIYAETRSMLIDYHDLSNLAPRLSTFVGTADKNRVKNDDRHYAMLAIEQAKKSIPEDGRSHPKVGAVVVKEGRILSVAHRGEALGSHAEYVALESKLVSDLIAGATIYTTLEPCTTRTHPKVPCAKRIIERKIARVVVGMFDPNPNIWGKGWQLLREAGIETSVFDDDLMRQCEEINREFLRAQKKHTTGEAATGESNIADG